MTDDAATPTPDLGDHRLWALRGAVQSEANDSGSILAASAELVEALVARNDLDPDRVVSCIFTATEDLDAEFPAVAARRLGFDRVPLICAREIPVPGSMPRVVRSLMHYYGPADRPPSHVYLGATAALRADLTSAQ
ncbi:chorismate mutase [Thermoleophilia bacterium SCSIO 60948]|nr:chorismate mutase [Thermoleophilia bacterium SCSIO 60948]